MAKRLEIVNEQMQALHSLATDNHIGKSAARSQAAEAGQYGSRVLSEAPQGKVNSRAVLELLHAQSRQQSKVGSHHVPYAACDVAT